MNMKHFLVAALMFVSAPAFAEIKEGLAEPYDAPKIEGIADWINSEPLGPEQLKGKVMLVDFWAYSCVNCVRTLPYLAEWDKKYRDKGLVIIGVHAPEFEFEKEKANVERAVKKWHVPYPVALDNDMKTWNNFKNQYWPAHYLISREGKVVYTHFGEGKYELTENNIRALLGLDEMKEAGKQNLQPENQTPETYLGHLRAEHFYSAEGAQKDKMFVYTIPDVLPPHGWALAGKWKMEGEKITSGEKGAVLRLRFYAKNTYLVLGTTGKSVKASLMLDGKPLGALSGKDVAENTVNVEHHSLYGLVKQSKPAEHILEITAADGGLEAYAFTFGE